MTKALLLTGLWLGTFGNIQAVEINNPAFVYFGVGAKLQNYREDLSGLSIHSDSNPSALVQYSGMYTPLANNSGLYLETSSPLLTVSDTETWSHNSFGVLQTDRTEMGLSSLDIAKSHLFAPGQQTLYGLRYLQLHFTRYDFAPGAGASAYNSDLIANDSGNPAYADGVAFEIPGCTNHTNPPVEGMSCDSVAIQEAITSLSFTYAYKYDSYFRSDFSGPRVILETGISIPIVYIITNTSLPGASLMGSPGQGYGIYLNASTSVYSQKDLQIQLGSKLQRIHRDQVSDTSLGLIYPNTDTTTLALYTRFLWSLD